MITLALVRHAKSDWDDPALPDHDRPLTARGMRDAPVMAARLSATGFRPQMILASTAVRARTTADAFAAALGAPLTVQPALYGAPAETLLAQAARTRMHSVCVVAHNPGISILAERLSGGTIGMMPTCAVAVFGWDADDWDVATSIPATSVALDTPR